MTQLDTNKKIMIPKYMSGFKCIGSKCEDTCCVGWDITIDKNTYKKYKKCNNKNIKDQLSKEIARNRSNQTDRSYAHFKLNNQGRCPFLDMKNLCSIQIELGEEELCTTCSFYPRIYNNLYGQIEKSASLSCPEIAQRVLLNQDYMEFEEVEEKISNEVIFSNVLGKNERGKIYDIQQYFWDLRIFSIQIMKGRDYTIDERLIILGMFLNKVQEYIDTKKTDEIPNLIQSYTQMIIEGVFKEEIKIIPSQIELQIRILKELADERIYMGIKNQRYIDCFSEFLDGIQYKEDEKEETIAKRYDDIYKNFYRPYMDEHEYIFENYIVDYIFKTLFPLTNNKTVFENYTLLIIHYALIKMHLIGMIGYYKENFNVQHIVKCIQSFTKVVVHNNSYIQHIHELLKKNDMVNMAYMAIMIKH